MMLVVCEKLQHVLLPHWTLPPVSFQGRLDLSVMKSTKSKGITNKNIIAMLLLGFGEFVMHFLPLRRGCFAHKT